MKPLTWLLTAVLPLGCGGGGLASLQGATLTAREIGVPVILDVGFSNMNCPSTPNATATMNGAALTPTSLGGPGSGLLAGCNAIQFTGTAPSAPNNETVTFEVKDESKTLTMVVPGYFAARSASVVAPTGGLHVGDSVTLQTNPSTDSFDTRAGVGVDFTPSTAGQSSFTVKQVQVNGSTIEFTVPQPSPAIADGGVAGQISIQASAELAQVQTCTGATACTASLNTSYGGPATLLP